MVVVLAAILTYLVLTSVNPSAQGGPVLSLQVASLPDN